MAEVGVIACNPGYLCLTCGWRTFCGDGPVDPKYAAGNHRATTAELIDTEQQIWEAHHVVPWGGVLHVSWDPF